MANYSTDLNLVEIRPNIMRLGTDSWSAMHTEAKSIIDRILEVRWYQDEAAEYGVNPAEVPYDADLLSTTQVKRLSCYKALELIYEYLMKDTPEPDGFHRQMLHFRERFETELQTLLSYGIDYDWDDDGTIDESERMKTQRRTLKRQ